VNTIELRPIGIIHTPFKQPKGTPIQPKRSGGAEGTIEVYPEFEAGLSDLDGFSHISLIYYFHLSKGFELSVVPYLDTHKRGVFATRAPRRPNPLGFSTVRLEEVDGCVLHITDVDMIDGTPLLDIKPYVPVFDETTEYRLGWLTEVARNARDTAADERFHRE
jgi:tRNA (adenine37-N6)-methyltransferase